MTFENLCTAVLSIGIPGALLIYLTWRLDKFLTFLCGKLETYNKELGEISVSLRDVVEVLKQRK